MINNAEEIRALITEAKQRGEDITHLVARLIEIEKIPKKSKTPKVVTP